jgi:hypothetical protein
MISPGMIPAVNNCATETSAIEVQTSSESDGGKQLGRIEPTAVTAQAKAGE